MGAHHLERCGRCGCPNDHENKPCGREITQRARHPQTGEIVERTVNCECVLGVRSDVFLCRQVSLLIQKQEEAIEGIFNLSQILLVASGLEVNDKGEIQPKSNIVAPFGPRGI